MSLILTNILLLAILPGFPREEDTPPLSKTLLEVGYRQMYNLQFEEAHQSFRSWESSHPEDPLGPSSDAAAYLFSEFNRLGILKAEFLTNDEKIKKGKQPVPDPLAKERFESSLARSEQLADAALTRSPRDRNALFARLLALGLRADYTGLIEKRLFPSLGYMKSGRKLAQQLLTIDPTNYDAYIAIGVENYILGSRPAPLRWLLQMLGSQTDREQGIETVRLTAEKGHYLQPYARLLLAIAALRDKDRDRARHLLMGLAQEFPNNRLYMEELARLQ